MSATQHFAGPSSLPPVEVDCLDFLIRASSEASYPKSASLVAKGAPSEHLILVTEGLLVTECGGSSGELVPTEFYANGQLVTLTRLPLAQAPFQLRAVLPSACVLVPCAALLKACRSWPILAVSLGQIAAYRQLQEHLQQAQSRALPLESRILAHLLRFARPVPGQSPTSQLFSYRVPQTLLAGYFGVSREEVSRQFKKLVDQHVVERTADGYLIDRLEGRKYPAFAVGGAVEEYLTPALLSRGGRPPVPESTAAKSADD